MAKPSGGSLGRGKALGKADGGGMMFERGAITLTGDHSK